jgi:hypothetical protein
MFFDASTPDTSAYMVAGYVIFFIITVIYAVSLFIRERNLKRDLVMLENLRQEQAAAAAIAAPSKSKATAAKPSKSKKGAKKTRRKQ